MHCTLRPFDKLISFFGKLTFHYDALHYMSISVSNTTLYKLITLKEDK